MRIYLGNVNIASQINDWAAGFKANGCDVVTGAYDYRSLITEGGTDFNLNPKWMTALVHNKVTNKIDRGINHLLMHERNVLKKAAETCDVFFFLWNTFDKNYNDLVYLKERGKKIIVQFVGDDVRWEPAMKQEFNKFGMKPIEYAKYDYSNAGLEKKLMRMRSFEKYADLIYSSPNQSQLALMPFYSNFQNIDLVKFNEVKSQRKSSPRVLHMPSSPEFKGSKYILKVFDRLKAEGVDFVPVVKSGIPYRNALKLYEECDILVGQILCPGGGKQERELLASGKVVMSIIRRDYMRHLPEETPIIDVEVETLYDKLKSVIYDYPLRKKLAASGREFIKKYHDPQKVTARVLSHLEGEKLGYDYVPSFFRDEYIPEPDFINIYNKFNDFVKDCDWYQERVESGIRCQLKF